MSKIAEMRHRQGGGANDKAWFLMQNVNDENGVIDKRGVSSVRQRQGGVNDKGVPMTRVCK